MKSTPLFVVLAISLLALTLSASAREVVLPAGTLLQCTMNEPNFSSASVDVGDPVLCHLKSVTEFGQPAFPRGSYLVGHLESSKEPGHFWGKGYLQLQFDRIGLPGGDLPLETKVIATRGFKVDREGKIDGKGHAKRDIVEWMLPPLWPWKVIMLPARGPRPKLKGETVLSLRLMDDVQVPQTASTFGLGWHLFGQPQNESFSESASAGSSGEIDKEARSSLAIRNVTTITAQSAPSITHATYADFVSTSAGNLQSLPTSNGPLFILKTGMVLAVGNYQYQDGRITYSLSGGGSGTVNTDDVDWTTTTRVNTQRGIHMTLHGGHIITESSGF